MKLTQIIEIPHVFAAVEKKDRGKMDLFPLAGGMGKIFFQLKGDPCSPLQERLCKDFRHPRIGKSAILGGGILYVQGFVPFLDGVFCMMQAGCHPMVTKGGSAGLIAGAAAGIRSIGEASDSNSCDLFIFERAENSPDLTGDAGVTAEKLPVMQQVLGLFERIL